MIKNIYAIRDKLTGYMNPAPEDNDLVAMRAVSHVIKSDILNTINAKPSDFTLNCIGEYNTETGVITPCPVRVVCEVSNLVEKEIKKGGKK